MVAAGARGAVSWKLGAEGAPAQSWMRSPRRILGNRGVVVLRFDDVIGLWREGQRRLADADPAIRPALERVTDAIVDELRRGLGGPFTTDELARYYGEHGIDWCFDIAVRAAPGTPEAWDLTTVAGAAFARYVREAGDYAGGARIVRED